MEKKTLIYVFVLLISKLCSGSIIQSIKTGNWRDSSTWKNNILPSSTDSIIISFGDTIFINASNAEAKYIKNEYCTNNKMFKDNLYIMYKA